MTYCDIIPSEIKTIIVKSFLFWNHFTACFGEILEIHDYKSESIPQMH